MRNLRDQTSAAAPPAARAQVRAAEFVTDYVRCGSGPPLVILESTGAATTVATSLGAALSTCYRVVIPEPPKDVSRFANWLRAFLDGLGLPRAIIVACPGFCLPALHFALLDPDRVSRLILISDGDAEHTGLDGVLAVAPREKVPILVVHADRAPEERAEMVRRFLGTIPA